MSAVPHKEVVIVTGTTVKAPERFKLRGSLIGYLPLLCGIKVAALVVRSVGRACRNAHKSTKKFETHSKSYQSIASASYLAGGPKAAAPYVFAPAGVVVSSLGRVADQRARQTACTETVCCEEQG